MIWNWGFLVEGDCLSNTLVFDYLELDTYYKLELQIQVVLLVLVVIVVINYCCQFFFFVFFFKFCIITLIILVSTFETV